MGTRSLTTVLDQDGQKICTLYKQYDGYIEGGWGDSLKEWLTGRDVGNGIPGDRSGDVKFSNGMHGLAVQLIANFCSRKPGGFYLYPPDTKDVGEDYTYEIYPSNKIEGFSGTTSLNIRVRSYNSSILYDGPAEKLAEPIEPEE